MRQLVSIFLDWRKRVKNNNFLTSLKTYQINSRENLGVDFFFVSAFDTDTRNVIEEGVPQIESLELILKKIVEKTPEKLNTTIAIDAGANYGTYSLYFSRFFKKVIAYEPHPTTFKLLKLNLEKTLNVIIRDRAVSDCSGKATLYEGRRYHSGNFTLVPPLEEKKNGTSYQIQTTRLDDDFPKLSRKDRISLIKIDVEGFEKEVLTGAKKLIRLHSPAIIFELNGTPEKNAKLIKTLVDERYLKFLIPPQSLIAANSKKYIMRYLFSSKNPVSEFFKIYSGKELLELDPSSLPRCELVLTFPSEM